LDWKLLSDILHEKYANIFKDIYREYEAARGLEPTALKTATEHELKCQPMNTFYDIGLQGMMATENCK
jgi:hypothetical protein